MALSSRGGQACAGAGTERIADAHAQRIASLDFPLLETASRKAPCYRLPARRQALELTLPRWFGISTRALFLLRIPFHKAPDSKGLPVVYLRRRGNDPQLAPWLEGRNSHPSRHSMGGGCGGRRAGAGLVGAGTDALAAASASNLLRLFNEGMTVADLAIACAWATPRTGNPNAPVDRRVAERSGFHSADSFGAPGTGFALCRQLRCATFSACPLPRSSIWNRAPQARGGILAR